MSVLKKVKKVLRKVKPLQKAYSKIKVNWMISQQHKNLHKKGADLMNLLTDQLQKTDLQVFCAFGTMLGFVRDGGFIQHDCDIDMGILAGEGFSWEQLENELKKIGMRKVKYFTCDDVVTEQTYRMNGISVDFFRYTMLDNDQMGANIYYKLDGAVYESENVYDVRRRPVSRIENISVKSINGVRVLLPEHCEMYLQENYGSGWRVPDPNYVPDPAGRYQLQGKKGICHRCGE